MPRKGVESYMENQNYPILICGQKGSGCTEVAEILAGKLNHGIIVYDFSSLIRIAVGDHVDAGLTFSDFFARTTESGIIEHARLAILRHASSQAIIEGKSAFLGLDEKAFRILLVANRHKRVEHVAATQHVTVKEASRIVDESDKKRAKIVKKLYHKDWQALSLYDLVIDTTKISYHRVAEIIREYVNDAADATYGVKTRRFLHFRRGRKPTLLRLLERLPS